MYADLTNIAEVLEIDGNGDTTELLEVCCADCAPRVYADAIAAGEVAARVRYTWENNEADTPQHCPHCDVLLEFDMTTQGLEYIRTEVLSTLAGGAFTLDPETPVYEWHERYGEQVKEEIGADLSSVLDVDDVTRGYLACLIWTGQVSYWTDTKEFGGEPLDTGELEDVFMGSTDELPDNIQQQAHYEVEQFIEAIEPYLFYFDLPGELDSSALGHDFCLTRNRHGAGFWDRGWEELGTWLTSWAHIFGSSNLYGDVQLSEEGHCEECRAYEWDLASYLPETLTLHLES